MSQTQQDRRRLHLEALQSIECALPSRDSAPDCLAPDTRHKHAQDSRMPIQVQFNQIRANFATGSFIKLIPNRRPEHLTAAADRSRRTQRGTQRIVCLFAPHSSPW